MRSAPNPLRKMIYVGARPDLNGKTALVLPSGFRGHVKAQFDDVELKEAFGWHYFPSWCFEPVPVPEDVQ